jgi:hypothetical protein
VCSSSEDFFIDFCLDDLSIGESGIFRSSTIYYSGGICALSVIF